MKKSKMKIAGVLCFIMRSFTYMFYFGNPIAYYRSVKTAKQFISDNYPEYQYIRTRNNYWAGLYSEVAVPGSKDQHFLIWTDYKGNYIADTYWNLKENVNQRLSEQYELRIVSSLDSIKNIEKISASLENIPEEYLVMDKEYSMDEISELSRKYGCIAVHIKNEGNETHLQDTASYVKSALKESNLFFWKIYVGVAGNEDDKYLNTEYFLID